MKEYIAQSGGRYTYADDVLNLQELARSMTSIFEGCSNFIISGCEVIGTRITPGYVWINGKVRYYEGTQASAFPFYLYEKNHYESTTYANEVNKRGRVNYMVQAGVSVPQSPDEVTGALPGFIEMTQDYSPRFLDRFFGRYALLLESPFPRQTVKKELILTGKFIGEKDIESKTALSVVNAENGYAFRNMVKASGDASAGLYLNGLLVNEIVLQTDGTLLIYKQGQEIARIDHSGMTVPQMKSDVANYGAIRIQSNNIYNAVNATDHGAVQVNRYGPGAGNAWFRDFLVFDGKTVNPMLKVEGATNTVFADALMVVKSSGRGMQLSNKTYLKGEARLLNTLDWTDKNDDKIARIGYASDSTFDFSISNLLGSITLTPGTFVDIEGELRLGGVAIGDIYVALTDYNTAMASKVDKISGKGLSTEDFTTTYKEKLDSIMTGAVGGSGTGFVTEADITAALGTKLSKSENLLDLPDRARARYNLDVYSKEEGDARYLKSASLLAEIIALSYGEIDGKTPEQIIALKEQKQQTARDNIDAERRGTGELKLAKSANLSDLPDKNRARQNLEIYSAAQIDSMLSGKLSVDSAYEGAVFTLEHKNKLEGIKTGNFAGTNNEGVSVTQMEGYVLTSAVKKELDKKANRLLDGLSTTDRASVAANIAVYTKTESDAKYGALSSSFQDFVTYLVKTGVTTANAQKTLRDKIDAPGKSDLNNYLKKDGKLTDLVLGSETVKKQVCQTLGAAYAAEYQTKITDTGWLSCGGENAGTLYARQIGNVVCVQGTINTARRSSNTWGSIATIPNTISPPRFGCRQTMADFNDDHKYNRGCSFVIRAGSRTILMHERGTYNVTTELSFSYMT